ncbi:AAA family ATPase [Gracilibacillus alcaliphilus]|uniref:AAA family ATPase n=1 Tax=Gracilibacillus alcaliphilus TaxID=1401441 RepID=UPI00195C1769|nr:AAA family ATPase [Gracilibacillus alcaliphilus]MBM7678940.1 DNA repair exonuclease SbcCD ATPase subunit [Gracilibacillus alcaliphilus]
MKTIEIKELYLRNFKGIKDLVINFAGNTDIFGANGIGKTTVIDGFMWVLFDKDSQNQKKFDIKPQDEKGESLHGLEHEVKVTLIVDGMEKELRKVYKEKWTKKRGQHTAEFTGHTTDHFIDSVPVSKKEYEADVADIIDEDIFKLLTIPTYFNEQLHWKDRRETLLEIAGDVDDQDVIQSNRKLEKLAELLNGKSIDDVRRIIAEKRKEINAELERIPVRIDEATKNMPDVSGLSESEVNSQLDEINSQIETTNEQISDIKNGSVSSHLKAKISDIDLKLSQVKNQHEQDNQQVIYRLQAKLQEEQANAQIIKSKMDNLNDRQTSNKVREKELNANILRLRNEWNELNAEVFEHNAECVCPACGQNLPEDQVNEAREKAKQQFNIKKSEMLELVKNKGVSAKEKLVAVYQENESIQMKIQSLIEQEKKIADSLTKVEEDLKEAKESATPLEDNNQYQELMTQKKDLKQAIEDAQENVSEAIDKVLKDKSLLQAKQIELQETLADFKQVEYALNRIKELEEQQVELAAEFERQEEKLYLSEEFIRTKVNMLEDKISSKFQYARFKLFNKNINGGLEETCETMYKGVAYNSNLNNAAKVNVGLDIINTLSSHYGVRVPIFFDNAESVTDLIDSESQIIRLVVSKSDKDLRVETNEKVGVAQ